MDTGSDGTEGASSDDVGGDFIVLAYVTVAHFDTSCERLGLVFSLGDLLAGCFGDFGTVHHELR